jgi:hypothetical protein
VKADASGNFTLAPDTADLHGSLKEEAQGGQPNIGFWDNPQDYATWRVSFGAAGTYIVAATCATLHAGPEFLVEVDGQQVIGKASQTGSWAEFRMVELGAITIKQAGEQVVKVRPRDPAAWKAINLRSVKFTKAE